MFPPYGFGRAAIREAGARPAMRPRCGAGRMIVAGLPTPVGPFHVSAAGGVLTGAGWGPADGHPADPLLARALAQVAGYFDGRRRVFDLPLTPATGFAAAMRAAICAIPFGETRTYGDLARALGVSAQAVGQGCGANPFPIIVPCHRVLAAHGLGGYSGRGGAETKVALLRHEGAGGFLL